jgi:hypothetical protein
MPVFQLIYLSRTTLLGANEQLAALCEKWGQRNVERGLTGAVLFCDGFVLQLLEGEEQAVRSLFSVISQDSRHVDMRLIHTGEIEHRQFTDHRPTFLHLPGEAVNFGIVRQLTSRVSTILMTDKGLIEETRELIRRFQSSIVAGYETSTIRTAHFDCPRKTNSCGRSATMRASASCSHCNSLAA